MATYKKCDICGRSIPFTPGMELRAEGIRLLTGTPLECHQIGLGERCRSCSVELDKAVRRHWGAFLAEIVKVKKALARDGARQIETMPFEDPPDPARAPDSG